MNSGCSGVYTLVFKEDRVQSANCSIPIAQDIETPQTSYELMALVVLGPKSVS